MNIIQICTGPYLEMLDKNKKNAIQDLKFLIILNRATNEGGMLS